jgi:hypothetical protein
MRKWVVVFLAVALLLVGVLQPLVMPRHCPVNRVAFERIEVGMTEAEVHALLGGPPGDYRTRPGPDPGWFDNRTMQVLRDEQWFGDEGSVVVLFDRHEPNPVVFVSWFDEPAYSPGLLELARWRLERLKERLRP